MVRLLSDAKPTQCRELPMTVSTPTLEDFQKFSKDHIEAFTAASTTFNRVLQQVLPSVQTLFYLKQLTR